MADLVSGDYVLCEVGQVSRVVINQHRTADDARYTSEMVQIQHEAGRLDLTPDHVVKVDGAFVAAREVAPGCLLGEYKVKAVTRGVGGVINPITVAGTILAAGKEGKPVLASTYPEWVSGYMLTSSMPLPLSLSNLLTYLFPATAQAFYEGLVEPLFPSAGGSYRSYLEGVPAALAPAAFVAGDLAASSAFFAFSLGPVFSLGAVLVATTVIAAAMARK